MKILSIILSASLLSGCASTVCNPNYENSLLAERECLVKMRKEISGYVNGKKLPGETGLKVHRNVAINQLSDNYNQKADVLNYKHKHFNMVCGE